MAEAAHPFCKCLFYSANALARNLTRLAEEAFAQAGLAPSLAFVVLTVGRNPGIQPSEIARIMMLSPSTLTRLVEKLEGRGLLRREAKGKAIHIQLTAKGEALVPALMAAWQASSQRTAALLGEEAARRLADQAYAAAQALEAEP